MPWTARFTHRPAACGLRVRPSSGSFTSCMICARVRPNPRSMPQLLLAAYMYVRTSDSILASRSPGLLKLVGRRTLEEKLHTLFARNGTSRLPDTTGTVGMYAQGNEPSHHVIFWYYLLGRPDEAERHLATVLGMYTSADNGIIGNDDAGALSSWYVCVMLGFYPVDPTNATMLRFPPRVQRVVRVGTDPV